MTWSDVPGEEALPNLKDSGEGILQLGKGIANAGAAMQRHPGHRRRRRG